VYICRSISRLAGGQNEIAKSQVSINSNNSSIACKNATGNGHFQPERESDEYSSTRGSPTPRWSLTDRHLGYFSRGDGELFLEKLCLPCDRDTLHVALILHHCKLLMQSCVLSPKRGRQWHPLAPHTLVTSPETLRRKKSRLTVISVKLHLRHKRTDTRNRVWCIVASKCDIW